jgi:rubrerythrin
MSTTIEQSGVDFDNPTSLLKDEDKKNLEDLAGEIGPQTVDINRLPSPYVKTDEGGRVHGSIQDTEAEIARLEEKKKVLRRQEAQDAERSRKYQALKAETERKLREEILSDYRAISKNCGGTKTEILCPLCSAPGQTGTARDPEGNPVAVSAGRFPIVRSVPLAAPEQLTQIVTIAVPAVFYLHKQSDGSLQCPRCGWRATAF